MCDFEAVRVRTNDDDSNNNKAAMDDNRSLDRPDFLSTTPESVAARLESSAGEEVRTAVVLEHALRYGVTHGDVELVRWLVGLDGRLVSLRSEERVKESERLRNMLGAWHWVLNAPGVVLFHTRAVKKRHRHAAQ